MKNYENITNSELLTMLLDGELNGEQESDLYSALANDPELQSQLEHQLAVKEAVKSDVEAFTPPVEATFNIFNKLGYAVPAGIPSVSSFWNKLFNRRVAATAALLLVSSLAVTTFIVSNNEASENKNISSNISNIIAINDINHNATDDDNYIQNNSTQASQKITKVRNVIPVSNSSSVVLSEESKIETISFTTNDQFESKQATTNDNYFAELNYSNMSQNNSYNFAFLQNSQFDAMRLRMNPVQYNDLIAMPIKNDNSIYVRGIMSSYGTPFQGGLNNFMLGYERKWKDNLSFAVEIGSQTINRMFSDDFTNNLTAENRQVFLGAFALRYEAKSLSLVGISPTIQARFGFGSDFNYMYGLSLGTIWNMETLPISISAAYELSNFQYTHISKSYNFNNSGLIFGIHYNF